MYPDNIDRFTEKLNKLENNTYVIEEAVILSNGKYEGELAHDNVSLPSISVYTGTKLTGDKIDNFIISTPSLTPWKKSIKIFSKVSKVYITYETQGDTVEAEDINKVQESIVNTQTEVDKYKSSNNLEVGNLKVRTSNLENNKSEKTYVDTELNKRYLKEQVFTKEEILQKIKDVIGVAPQALDTLQEIAKSLNNDSDFAGTITKQLATKVDKAQGKQLSTEDYTTAEKQKLVGVEQGANKYIHPSSHSADMVVENENRRFASDTDKNNWNEAYSKRHEHGNKSIVDRITQVLIDSWNSAVDHIKDTVKHITGDERNAWNSKANGAHDHDGRYYTEIEIDNIVGLEDIATTKKTLKGAINEIKAIVATGGSVDNANKLNGKTAEYYLDYTNLTKKPTGLPANGGNADLLNGKRASDFMTKGPVTWNNLKGV